MLNANTAWWIQPFTHRKAHQTSLDTRPAILQRHVPALKHVRTRTALLILCLAGDASTPRRAHARATHTHTGNDAHALARCTCAAPALRSAPPPAALHASTKLSSALHDAQADVCEEAAHHHKGDQHARAQRHRILLQAQLRNRLLPAGDGTRAARSRQLLRCAGELQPRQLVETDADVCVLQQQQEQQQGATLSTAAAAGWCQRCGTQSCDNCIAAARHRTPSLVCVAARRAARTLTYESASSHTK